VRVQVEEEGGREGRGEGLSGGGNGKRDGKEKEQKERKARKFTHEKEEEEGCFWCVRLMPVLGSDSPRGKKRSRRREGGISLFVFDRSNNNKEEKKPSRR